MKRGVCISLFYSKKNDFLCNNLKTHKMIKFIQSLFGWVPKPDFAQHLNEGAIILDVRSPAEFENRHIEGAINIPLNTLTKKMNQLQKDKVIITCCASGVRSASAKNILKLNDFTQVFNGGGWRSLQRKLKA
jgi:rhodanese-related sulfurtransferase